MERIGTGSQLPAPVSKACGSGDELFFKEKLCLIRHLGITKNFIYYV
jgi:hypothetical protein